METQKRLHFRKPKFYNTPVDLSRMDFGPEDGYNFRLPIKVQPRGFSYRYGRPANKVTVGIPSSYEPQFAHYAQI
jgi:hypothetical protein